MPAAPARKNGSRARVTIFQAVFRSCSIRAPSPAPMAWDNRDVRPLESPTQQAIMANSSGIARPMAASAASPRMAA